MHPINVLTDEHRTMEKMLGHLCSFTGRVKRQKTDGRATMAEFISFLRIFDKVHHMKEEDLLFAAMERNGFPKSGGPVAVMLSDHAVCRNLVGKMDEAARLAEPWTDAQRDSVDRVACEYRDYLGAHIQKEDGILYPMARQAIPPDQWSEMERQFPEFDARQPMDEFKRLMEKLSVY